MSAAPSGMRTKLLIAVTLLMAIMPLVRCSGSSVEAARAAVPQILPAPHPPLPRPPVRVPRPRGPGVHIPPGDAAGLEVKSSCGYANSSGGTRK
jgi:hypothetical protein